MVEHVHGAPARRVLLGRSGVRDPEESLRAEGAAEATVRWRAHMREYFMPEVTTDEVVWLREIFRLD